MSAVYRQRHLPITSLLVLDQAIELCQDLSWAQRPKILLDIEQNQNDFNDLMRSVESAAEIIEALGIEMDSDSEELDVLALRSKLAGEANAEAEAAMSQFNEGMVKLDSLMKKRQSLLNDAEAGNIANLSLRDGQNNVHGIAKVMGKYSFTHRQGTSTAWLNSIDANYRQAEDKVSQAKSTQSGRMSGKRTAMSLRLQSIQEKCSDIDRAAVEAQQDHHRTEADTAIEQHARELGYRVKKKKKGKEIQYVLVRSG